MNKLSLGILAIAASALLSGCGSSTDDLQEWMNVEGSKLKGQVPPLPPVAPFKPLAYVGAEMGDPFAPKKAVRGGSANAPDQARKKEFLESYPLDQIQMVGTIFRHGVQWGLVRSPDNNINMVRAGNYMGQNFGKIVGISDASVKLKETVQDAQGEWAEREVAIEIAESASK